MQTIGRRNHDFLAAKKCAHVHDRFDTAPNVQAQMGLSIGVCMSMDDKIDVRLAR